MKAILHGFFLTLCAFVLLNMSDLNPFYEIEYYRNAVDGLMFSNPKIGFALFFGAIIYMLGSIYHPFRKTT